MRFYNAGADNQELSTVRLSLSTALLMLPRCLSWSRFSVLLYRGPSKLIVDLLCGVSSPRLDFDTWALRSYVRFVLFIQSFCHKTYACFFNFVKTQIWLKIFGFCHFSSENFVTLIKLFSIFHGMERYFET